MTSLEGCLLSDQQKSYGAILVNAASSWRRQRYTIAHELGHFLNERHVPTSDDGFRCTREDMSHPARSGRHLRQEREANSFAIELLAPAKRIQSHLSRAADLEHAIANSEAQDISKEAAVRRYVALHDERLAAAFSVNGRIRYVEKGSHFPHLVVWTGDKAPALPLRPRAGSDLSTLDEVSPGLWLCRPDGVSLFAQTLFQAQGYATTLLLAEWESGEGNDDDQAPRTI